jgi:hypothetical protein
MERRIVLKTPTPGFMPCVSGMADMKGSHGARGPRRLFRRVIASSGSAVHCCRVSGSLGGSYPGELAVFERYRPHYDGKRVLNLGVGPHPLQPNRRAPVLQLGIHQFGHHAQLSPWRRPVHFRQKCSSESALPVMLKTCRREGQLPHPGFLSVAATGPTHRSVVASRRT